MLLFTLSAARLPAAQRAEQQSFANARLLVQTDWLDQHKGDAGLRVVDVRSAKAFATGHIAGARNIPVKSTFLPKGPSGLLGSAEQIAALFGAHGIDGDVRIILIDEGKSTAAARVFWTLEVYGHRDVSVVDGGLAKWKAEKRGLTKDVAKHTPLNFASKRPSPALSTKEHVLEDVENPDVVMLDARSAGEFGRGRIPQAVHLEWTDNYTSGDVPVFKSPGQLRLLYASRGVTSDKRVHAY
jgi:thiosulfate/3-mercaptopyruvate sulfurtransferase